MFGVPWIQLASVAHSMEHVIMNNYQHLSFEKFSKPSVWW
ncbi:hypothetical protein [uncultured Gammaproteobacteria bacterium]|nr:hypothetical protein [uncultured Gammaproteobacteria bacterium]